MLYLLIYYDQCKTNKTCISFLTRSSRSLRNFSRWIALSRNGLWEFKSIIFRRFLLYESRESKIRISDSIFPRQYYTLFLLQGEETQIKYQNKRLCCHLFRMFPGARDRMSDEYSLLIFSYPRKEQSQAIRYLLWFQYSHRNNPLEISESRTKRVRFLWKSLRSADTIHLRKEKL